MGEFKDGAFRSVDDGHLLIADIPGLIEGASEGKGLGDTFLRHVERTAVLLHLIDAYAHDPAGSYVAIRRELENYSAELATRPEIVALTKCEGLDDDIIAMQIKMLREVAPEDTQIYAISATAHTGLTDVLRELRKRVVAARIVEGEKPEEIEDTPVITLSSDALSEHWDVTFDNDEEVYRVTGEKIEKFARRTNYEQFESVNRLRDIMRRYGITHEINRMGASGQSMVQIGDSTPFTLTEQ